jgi:predicted MFS family arabinose efflux permease
VVVTLLAIQVAPPAGLLVALACSVAGTLALAPQRHTEPPPSPPALGGQRRSATRVAGLWVLTATFVGFGGVFGSAEVAVVAFTEERGQQAAAAMVLALIAAGSMLAGVWYGSVRWRSTLDQRFRVSVGALAMAVAILPVMTRIPVLAVALFVAGLAVSPSIIAAFGLIEALVPASVLTEGLTWATTGIGVGIAAGSMLSGAIVDARGAQIAFAVTACSGFAAAGVALTGGRWLRAPPRPASASAPVTEVPV